MNFITRERVAGTLGINMTNPITTTYSLLKKCKRAMGNQEHISPIAYILHTTTLY